MTTDRDALLAAVIADPDDDLPRLVYADYLDDLGGEANVARAEFIRAEVTAERLPDDDPERERLETQAAGLFNQFGAKWIRLDLPQWIWSRRPVYRRGFVEGVEMSSGLFLKRRVELFRTAPITGLTLGDTNHFWHSDQFSRIFSAPAAWRHVSNLKVLGRLHYMQFENTPSCEALARALVQSEVINRLTRIDCSTTGIDDHYLSVFVGQLAESPFGRRLTSLNLADNHITDAGAWLLVASRGLDRLSELNLSGNRSRTRISESAVESLRTRFGPGVVA